MTHGERQSAIVALERKLLDTMDAYVLAIRKKESFTVKEAIYAEVDKIKREIRLLKAGN